MGGQLGISWKGANDKLIWDVHRKYIPGAARLAAGSKNSIKCRIPVNCNSFLPLQVDDETQVFVVKSLLELCGVVEQLVSAEAEDEGDLRCDRLRQLLNELYDRFVIEYGYLTNCKSYFSGFFLDLRLSTYLTQLEKVEKFEVSTGAKKKKETRISKAEIFNRRINYPPRKVTGQIFFDEDLDARIAQAFSWCMGFHGTVDLKEVAEKSGVAQEVAEKSLLDQNLIYREWLGLAEMQWWELLDVFPNCTIEDLKAAYRRKSREYHPDLNPSPAATLMMQRINAAYEKGKKSIDAGG